MKNVVVLGLKDDDKLWLVDLENGSVRSFEVADNTSVAQAVDLRRRGAQVIKGVAIALASDDAPEAFSGFMDT